ncbi:hypothetical protein [Desulfofalx alkaliphila]|uniref:hypothetical protein n=1 Tax=Desulfofalx alkaliphila TaxID=105483 RepID=UPI0004E23B64|nr:hypothetical protein [Desulfofalx alkaliphila]
MLKKIAYIEVNNFLKAGDPKIPLLAKGVKEESLGGVRAPEYSAEGEKGSRYPMVRAGPT